MNDQTLLNIMIFSLLMSFGSIVAVLIDENLTMLSAERCRMVRLLGVVLVFFGTCYGVHSLLEAKIITP